MIHPDAKQCEQITRHHARTFALASRFLPPRKRRAAFAVYAFCRIADDIVDAGVDGAGPSDMREAATQLQAHRVLLHEALSGRPEGAIFRELAWTVSEFGVPHSVLHELVDGVARDLTPRRYATWHELETYCNGVASTVGVMCTHIFGVSDARHDSERALTHASTLGVAMQLTNVLRDVGDDARRGRCYLPDDDLARFGITADEITDNPSLSDDPRWHEFMAFEIRRARALYANAMRGIALLERDSRRCAAACAIGYSRILDAIERIEYDSLHHRAHLSPFRKVGVLFDVMRFSATHQGH